MYLINKTFFTAHYQPGELWVSNIYLIGPRACGKTTVGEQLADKLRLDFFDSDEVLVRKAGLRDCAVC